MAANRIGILGTLFAAVALVFASCDMLTEKPAEFLAKYSKIASVDHCEFDGNYIIKDGNIHINPSQNFTITYYINNPGNLEIDAKVEFAQDSAIDIGNGASLAFANNKAVLTLYSYAMAVLDGNTSKNLITPKLVIFSTGEEGRIQSAYPLSLRCNSPPPLIPNALTQMVDNATESQRLIIAFDMPSPLAGDVEKLIIAENRKNTTHNYSITPAGIAQAPAGETWTISNTAPAGMKSTYSGGPIFASAGGKPHYITTDIYNLQSLNVFDIVISLVDTSGLDTTIVIPSHTLKLNKPYTNHDGAALSAVAQDADKEYGTFIIYPPSNGSGATINYNILSFADPVNPSPIADIKGSTSQNVGTTTFRLYPNIDGTQRGYMATMVYASLTGYLDSENIAFEIGNNGNLTIEGRKLTLSSNNTMFNVDDEENADYVLTSEAGTTINYTVEKGGATYASGSGTSPVHISLPVGTYSVKATATKDYFQTSNELNDTSVKVSSSVVYINSPSAATRPGNDTTGDGSKDAPFATIAKACQAIGSPRISVTDAQGMPQNVVYILGDMETTGSFMAGVPSDAAIIVRGCKDGTKGSAVTLNCNNTSGASFGLDSAAQTVLAKDIKFTRSNASTTPAISLALGTFIMQDCSVSGIKSNTGAMNVSGGTFRINGKVTITGNYKADGTTPCNLYLDSYGYVVFKAGINIAGTKIGVTTEGARLPSNVGDIGADFTVDYKTACGTTAPSTYFTSDNSDYVVVWNSAKTNAVLSKPGSGGNITPPPSPDTVTFSLASSGGDGSNIVINAVKNGTTSITGDISAWTVKVYKGLIDTGYNGTSNIVDISSYPQGKYTIKVCGKYDGFDYNGNLEYTLVEGVFVNIDDLQTYLSTATGPTKVIVNATSNDELRTKVNPALKSANYGVDLVLTDDITTIKYETFNGCTKLTSVEIPDSVTSIERNAFSGSGLTSLEIPDSVTSIGDSAFSSCTSLTSVEIPGTITSRGENIFSFCTSLTSVKIQEGATGLGRKMFENCTSLTNVELPNSMTSISDYAFTGCTSLASLEIPDSVTSIGGQAFNNCKSLTSLKLPSNLKYISSYAFSGSGLTSVEIPGTVTIISMNTFSNCTSLANVKIQNGVASIASKMFQSCTSLVSVEIPNSMTSISDYAFSGCTSLVSVEIPNSMTSISDYAFSGCTSLESVTVRAEEPPSLGSGVFNNNKSGRKIYVPNTPATVVDTYKTTSGWSDYAAFIEPMP